MINCVEKVYTKLGNSFEEDFVNEVEKVYNANIDKCGGFSKVSPDIRRLAWQTAVDEVSVRFKYRLAKALW